MGQTPTRSWPWPTRTCTGRSAPGGTESPPGRALPPAASDRALRRPGANALTGQVQAIGFARLVPRLALSPLERTVASDVDGLRPGHSELGQRGQDLLLDGPVGRERQGVEERLDRHGIAELAQRPHDPALDQRSVLERLDERIDRLEVAHR